MRADARSIAPFASPHADQNGATFPASSPVRRARANQNKLVWILVQIFLSVIGTLAYSSPSAPC